MVDINSILEIISVLDLKQITTFLAGKGIYDLSKEGFESIRKVIQDKVNTHKFGFTPKKDEHNVLIKIAQRQYYQEFRYLIGNHPHSDLIRVGYLISHLNKMGGIQNSKRVQEISDSIFHRPNGAISLKIVRIVTTGAIVPIADYLSELKKRNYDKTYLIDRFNEIIIEWNKYTIFVKSQDTKEQILEEIKIKMGQKQNLIMIFAYGSAKSIATQAVAEIYKDKGDYFYESKNNIEGDKETHSSVFSLMD